MAHSAVSPRSPVPPLSRTSSWGRMSRLSRAPSTFSPVVGEIPEFPARHDKFYIPSGDVVFLVEDTLFRVHRYFFVRESVVFRDMLSLPTAQGTELEGGSDMNPIRLPQVTSLEFSRFLWVFYNPKHHIYEAKWDVWASILRLAHVWQFEEVKALAVSKLDGLEVPPVDKAVLALEFDIQKDWLVQAYAALGARPEPLTVEEAERLGLSVAILAAAARERIRERRLLQAPVLRGRSPDSRPLSARPSLSLRTPLGLPSRSGSEERSVRTASPTPMPETPAGDAPPPLPACTKAEYTPEDIADVKAIFGL